MEPLTLARLQFGITTVYHFFFVPLTIGLALLVALLQTQYVRTGQEKFKQLTKFWGKLLLINFAIGVATGIVQEFQFGMNWSEYSRFVGDIFGAPLAVEALAAFFIESTFLGVWIFGWDRLSKKMHLAAIWLVSFASMLSAFWILVANSFMQHPVGYELVNGRAQMTDFFAVITNPNVMYEFPHVVLGALTTASFFMLGISAYHLLRNRQRELFQTSARFAAYVGCAAVLCTMLVGHFQGQHMAKNQPMKLAVSEGLWNTEDPAALSLFQIADETTRKATVDIAIPAMLSGMVHNSLSGAVPGINDIQAEYVQKYGEGNYVPPAVWLNYWSFRSMVGAGSLMFALAAFYVFQDIRKKNIPGWLMMVLPYAIALPYLANSTGWILTEMGRQPWLVQGVLTLEKGLSPNVDATELLISLIGFTVLYAVLIVADVYLMQKFARNPESTWQTVETNPAISESMSAIY